MTCDEFWLKIGMQQPQQPVTRLMGSMRTTPDAQVLIIGGGPAGIEAAAKLVEYGVDDFLILEDGEQLRGYLEPVEFGGLTFAPGSLWAFTSQEHIDELGLTYTQTNYDSYTVYNDDGENVTAEAKERESVFFDALKKGLDQVTDDIDKDRRPDLSYKATLARGGWIGASAVEKVMEWYNLDFYEGLSPRDISTIQSYRQKKDENLSIDEFFILDDRTLGHILSPQEALISEDKIILNARAVSVNQKSDEDDYVRVSTEDGNEYVGEYVIVTSTVGVIQNGGLTFEPPLPPWKTEQFCRYQMAILEPFFLKFDTKFWDDTEYILHASDRKGYYPAFLNLDAEGYRPGNNILIGWLVGDEAYRAELLSDEEVQAEVLEVLRNMYGESNVPDPTEFYMSRFATDENLYGTFASWPIGTNPKDAAMRLRAPVGRVYFAPEDAADEYIGIPNGSIMDGIFAATGVTECIQDEDCDEYTPVDDPSCRPLPQSNKRRKIRN
ncbi:uncharacterized protein [Amphiura filiformis]|uniref:uncharacterized protein n=1 Tax=Amphiura filiformis TaxID=82378 RepID=UPI003B216DDD